MKKRIFALFLAVLLLAGFTGVSSALTSADLAADVDEDGEITARDAAIIARYLARWEGYVTPDGSLTYPDKPAGGSEGITSFTGTDPVDFNGRVFTVLATDSTTAHFSTKMEISGEGTTRFSIVNAAAIARNNALESTYNCTVQPAYSTAVASDLRYSILAGTHEYDLVYLPMDSYAKYAASAFILDLNAIPTVEDTFFEAKASDAFSINGKLFVAIGSATPSVERNIYALVADRAKVLTKTGVDVLDVVLNGQWTIQKMIELGQTCAMTYEFGALDSSNIHLFMGAGGSFGTRSAGIYVADPTLTQASQNALQALALLEPHRESLEGSSIVSASSKGPFTCIHVAAVSNWTISNDCAVLPLPTVSASDPYRCVPHAPRMMGFVIPASVNNGSDYSRYGFSSAANMEGYFLSAFFAASDTAGVRSSYRTLLLNKNFIKNVQLEKKTQCLDLLFNSVAYDFVYYANTSSLAKVFNVKGDSAVQAIPSSYSGVYEDNNVVLGREMALLSD